MPLAVLIVIITQQFCTPSSYSVSVSKPFQGRRGICANCVLTSGKKAIIMVFLLIAAALICSTAAANAPCSSLYVSYDLSPNFNETIAHSIHSMTVQGLRLFNPLATEDNRVPTVNHDIHDEVTSCSYTLLLSFSVMCYWLCFSRP